MVDRVAPREASPSAPAPALCPNSGPHLGVIRIGGRGQLRALILDTKLDGKTLSEQNQGCLKLLLHPCDPLQPNPPFSPASSLLASSHADPYTHTHPSVSHVIFCLLGMLLFALPPLSLVLSFRFSFSPTTSRKSSRSAQLSSDSSSSGIMGLISR